MMKASEMEILFQSVFDIAAAVVVDAAAAAVVAVYLWRRGMTNEKIKRMITTILVWEYH
jgi:hypothetical protein